MVLLAAEPRAVLVALDEEVVCQARVVARRVQGVAGPPPSLGREEGVRIHRLRGLWFFLGRDGGIGGVVQEKKLCCLDICTMGLKLSWDGKCLNRILDQKVLVGPATVAANIEQHSLYMIGAFMHLDGYISVEHVTSLSCTTAGV